MRVVGVDDGSFDRRQRYAPIAAVVLSAPQDLESVSLGRIRVDGDDATEEVLRLLQLDRHVRDARALLLDGISVGGFNILDLDALYRATGLPVLSVTRRRPDFEKIRSALRTYFPREFARRWRRVKAHRLFPVPTGAKPIYAAAVGCRRADAIALLRRVTLHGYWPEPLRLAHLVARSAAGAGRRASARTKPYRPARV